MDPYPKGYELAPHAGRVGGDIFNEGASASDLLRVDRRDGPRPLYEVVGGDFATNSTAELTRKYL